MCSRGVLVHCLSRLGAATTVLAAKLPSRNRVFAECTLECAKAIHYFDRIMSHTFSVFAYLTHDSRLKFNSARRHSLHCHNQTHLDFGLMALLRYV
jgi:hypothetical protein